jgi:hypothetical protein
MIMVWMIVFNEEQHLQGAIDSVLAQTYTGFTLLISDNFSTDSTPQIIDAAARRDSRIRKISPPTHLSAIEHGRYVHGEVLGTADAKYSIFVGGHDLWHPQLLECLFARAEAEPSCAIVYTDSVEIDAADNVTKRYSGIVQSSEISRPFIPHHILLGMTHNILAGGLWTEAIRKTVPLRHACAGCDHLMIAEMALRGAVIYQPGSVVYLRAANYAGMQDYVKKHIPEHLRNRPILDFLNQLEWCDHLAEQAVQGTFYSQDGLKNMLKSSLFSGYILRYVNNLSGFTGGVEQFFSHPLVQEVMSSNYVAASKLQALIRSRS